MEKLQRPAPGEVFGDYVLLREHAGRGLQTFDALDPRGEVVVLELLRRADASEREAARFVWDARTVIPLQHPNVARVRGVRLIGEHIVVVSDFVDGVSYGALTRAAKEKGEAIPLLTRLRIVVDVLRGLSGFHALRDAARQRTGVIHGAVSPENVIVGIDGNARLVHVCHVPRLTAARGADASTYVAPEARTAGANGDVDARADLFGVGAILREASTESGAPKQWSAGAVLLRVLGDKVETPRLQEASWAGALFRAGVRATAPNPSMRFANAGDMVGELARVAGAKLPSREDVGSIVESLCGEEIRARRASLAAASPAREPSFIEIDKRDLDPDDAELDSLLSHVEHLESAPPKAPFSMPLQRAESLTPLATSHAPVAAASLPVPAAPAQRRFPPLLGRVARVVGLVSAALAFVGLTMLVTLAIISEPWKSEANLAGQPPPEDSVTAAPSAEPAPVEPVQAAPPASEAVPPSSSSAPSSTPSSASSSMPRAAPLEIPSATPSKRGMRRR